jgi:Lrp/AsnC family transcriptional regulator
MNSVVELDEADRTILRVLQERADLSIADLAAKAGLSYTPCWRRLKRLEDLGVIEKRVALVSDAALGLGVTVLVQMSLNKHDEDTLHRFERAVQTIDEVMECYAVSGEKDFQLRVVVGSVQAYDKLLKSKLVHLPGVASVSSHFVLTRVKYTTKLPV